MSDQKRIWREVAIHGTGTSPGIAIGQAFVFKPFTINLSELETQVEDTGKEIQLLDNARQKVYEQLDYAQHSAQDRYSDDFNEIFESQKAFLQDPVLRKEIENEIVASAHTAAFVVSRVLSQKSDYFINLENNYFRERAYDIMDLKQKLINALLGIDVDYQLNKPAIVVADILSPTDTVNFNRNLIQGFLTDRGGVTSHAAILARGLRIPAVVNGLNLSQIIQNDDSLIIDGYSGTLILNPSESTIDYYKKLQKKHQKIHEKLRKESGEAAVTRDGASIGILANLEFLNEAPQALACHADGVGLFRTESMYMNPEADPTEDHQYQIYKSLVEQMESKPVTIRTVDLGGDKLVEGYTQSDEQNPFLGWRAIRFCLDRQDIFRAQLRALLRASAYGTIRILIPMVSSADEILRTKKLIKSVVKDLHKNRLPYDHKIKIGIMVETPATAVSAEIYAEYVDFFSIGTNDLTQYTLAIDRTNDKVAQYYNPFNPAVLELIARTVSAAKEKNIDVELCGEMSSQPEAIPLLLGMGLRALSMTPFFIPEVKKIIRSVNIKDCESLWQEVQQKHLESDIEELCQQFIRTNVPELFAIKEEN